MITQNNDFINYTNFINDFLEKTNYLNNHTIDFSVDNYIDLVTTLAVTIKNIAIEMFLQKIKMIDEEFKNKPERLQRYYIKDTRNRTIITPFGEITFKRTIYQNRQSNKCYTHVDRILGLPKYDRYDPAVKSMIVESYADQNSMIKVGKIIGDKIFSAYSIDDSRYFNIIPRQTVYNIVSKMKIYSPTEQKQKTTPKTLYIMSDEHFVPLQGCNGKDAMMKVGVIFESLRRVKGHSNRNEYTNKYYHISFGDQFWDDMYKIITERYDINQIKQIYIMGDGATWIKKGVESFKRHKAVFGLDRFHMKQAIIRLTTNKDERELLLNYVNHLDKESFMTLAKSIVDKESSISTKSKKSTFKYFKNNWNAYKIMSEKIIIGCGMEGQISHYFASIFKSVPKAYNEDNLYVYATNRTLMLNGYDLRKVYIKTIKSKETIVTDNKPINWAIFDGREAESNYSLPPYLRGSIAKK